MKYWTILVLLIVLAQSQLGYQDRKVYYNDRDHICYSVPMPDVLNIIISGDGQLRKLQDIITRSQCNVWAPTPVRSIMIPREFSYYVGDQYDISFTQQVFKETYGMLVYGIIVRARVENPVLFQKKQYNCTVYGDNTQQHYGTHNDQFPPATIHLNCKPYIDDEKAKKEQIEQQK